MRIRRAAAVALVAATVGCGRGAGGLLQQYEYEEDIYLSLDGTATVYVNSSVAALDALRGATLDAGATARVDADGVRAFYTTPVTHVASVTESRRSGRRFVHVRLEVDDIRRLGAAAPFAWSTYDLRREGGLYLYRQITAGVAGRIPASVRWTGREMVAFRLHLPSKIAYHNAGVDFRPGNILVWEQSLTDRLRGSPVTIEARMATQSILYSALRLFGGAIAAVALMFGVVIWWVRGRGDEGAGNRVIE